MPFPPKLTPILSVKLQEFALANDFPKLYRSYIWRNDDHATGFRDILRLEVRLTGNQATSGIMVEDVLAVAEWGGLANRGVIKGSPVVLPAHSLRTVAGDTQSEVKDQPDLAIGKLKSGITQGVGPTYLTKILRFALPQEYGALDTRCVRVFGKGSVETPGYGWINLSAQKSGTRWAIPATQAGWPSEYGTWINVLRFFASMLSADCPHPPRFYDRGLRRPGMWECADVEMALFTYASGKLDKAKGRR